MPESEKVFLEIENVYRLKGDFFGEEWNEIRRRQIGFLLERPLMFKVLTEKVWGPAKLNNLWIDEWWESEQAERSSDKRHEVEELADMTLLFLTLDSFNPNLSLPSHLELLRLGWDGTVKSYCDAIGINRDDLKTTAEQKITINELRNPREAFMLVPDEDMQASKKRMDHNWRMLKGKRDKMGRQPKGRDWWKKSLYVDKGGWIREKV